MEFIKNIQKDTILIIPNNIKNKVLQKLNECNSLLSVKLMNLEDIKKHLLFDYNVESLLYIMDNYNLDVDISEVILELLYLIDENKTYEDEKLRFISEIKKKLIDMDLLIFDNMFSEFIKDKDIFVYGYSSINKFYSELLTKIGAREIEISKNQINRDVYLFDTLEDEVEFIFNKICDLINNGTDCNKIKLVNVGSDYLYTIKRFSKMFSIPVRVDASYIYSTNIVKRYLSVLYDTRSFLEALNKIEEEYDLKNEKNNSIYRILYNISNSYNELSYSFDNIYKLVLRDIKSSRLSDKKLKNEIEICNLEDNIFDDEYVFLLGFNQGSIPKLYKDEEYLQDYVKSSNGLLIETTSLKNELSKNSVITSLNRIKNLFITTKNKTISGECLVSNLLNELNYNLINGKVDYTKSFSEINSKIKLTKFLDDFIKYGTKSENINLLYSNFDINYLTYNNKFSGLDNNLIINKLKSGLILSYTGINTYFNCGFRYYLTNILKLDKYEENFSTKVGNLFHYILSICFNNDFDLEEEYSRYIENIELDAKEKFFINKLKNELLLVINQVKKLHNETGLTKLLLEHKINIDKSTIVPVRFTGIVDKVMYREKDNNTLVSIIDYKTGNADINLYNVIYGLSMQLPIYLYLVKNSNLFNNVRFTGFYLQKILSSEVNFVPNKTYLTQKEDNLKLQGYSNSDIYKLEVFIPDYEDSKFVRSMKMSKKGFYSYAKILSDEQIDNLIKIIDKNINEARDGILNGEFSINPKQIGLDKVGCEFCKFYDICYRKAEDFIKLKINDSLGFIGGEENAKMDD